MHRYSFQPHHQPNLILCQCLATRVTEQQRKRAHEAEVERSKQIEREKRAEREKAAKAKADAEAQRRAEKRQREEQERADAERQTRGMCCNGWWWKTLLVLVILFLGLVILGRLAPIQDGNEL